MVAAIFWDPDPEVFSFPFFHFPILWYGVFFALGFWFAFLVFVQVFSRYSHLSSHEPLSAAKIKEIADRLTVYIVVGTILGARLGHFIFYEHPSDYLADPIEFFKLRNGGLASHGAIVGIIIAGLLFRARIRKEYPDLTWIRLLDFLAVPTALAGAFIRIGNFFNQEILGTPTNLPWAVVFGHPADGSFPEPRHPAQLYEAIWYLALFFLLWRLSKKASFLLKQGKLVGLFLILAFLFRFFVEFIKTEQSRLLETSWLTMGQILSIPAILLGCYFYLKRS